MPPRVRVASRHVGDVLSLVRQGLTLGVEYGTRSIEALLWVAETVEEGVYEPRSLHRTDAGLAFALDNPPLRAGAFTSLVLRVNGRAVPGDRIRWRPGSGSAWRTAASVDEAAPLDFGPGDRTEFEVDVADGAAEGSVTVRLELRMPAIPPLVWFEFTDRPSEAGSGP
jgi:hypothetical protein